MRTFRIATTPKLDEVLEEIRAATGRADDADVLRDALEFYDLVIQQAKRGKRIHIGEDRERSAEVKLPNVLRAQASRFVLGIIEIFRRKD